MRGGSLCHVVSRVHIQKWSEPSKRSLKNNYLIPGSSFQNIPPAPGGDRTGNQIFWYKNAAEIFLLLSYFCHFVKSAMVWFCSQEWCRSLWRQCCMTSCRHSKSRRSRCGIPANYSTQDTRGEEEILQPVRTTPSGRNPTFYICRFCSCDDPF